MIRIDPPRVVVVHAPERQPIREDVNDPWTVHKVARDRGFVHVVGEYNRETMFRLIGQLERVAASL